MPEPMVVIGLVGSLKDIYGGLLKSCAKGCGTSFPLRDAIYHEINCGRPSCDNKPKCTLSSTGCIEGFNVCSEKCALSCIVNRDKAISPMQLSALIGGMVQRLSFPENSLHFKTYFDLTRLSPNIKLSSDLRTARCESKGKCFSTVLSRVGFNSCTNIVEFTITTKPDKPVKVGIYAGEDIDVDKAFSDSPRGYSFYTLGQLRNGDGGKGVIYAKRMEIETFTVALVYEAEVQTLSFIVNGVNQGIAFQDDSLKGVTVYPAVALREGSKVSFSYEVQDYNKIYN